MSRCRQSAKVDTILAARQFTIPQLRFHTLTARFPFEFGLGGIAKVYTVGTHRQNQLAYIIIIIVQKVHYEQTKNKLHIKIV